jgi:hypothetical protein
MAIVTTRRQRPGILGTATHRFGSGVERARHLCATQWQ